jgi:hypothetical protein
VQVSIVERLRDRKPRVRPRLADLEALCVAVDAASVAPPPQPKLPRDSHPAPLRPYPHCDQVQARRAEFVAG